MATYVLNADRWRKRTSEDDAKKREFKEYKKGDEVDTTGFDKEFVDYLLNQRVLVEKSEQEESASGEESKKDSTPEPNPGTAKPSGVTPKK